MLWPSVTHAEDAAKLFDQLYGPKVKEVVRTSSFADDVTFADELVSIASRYVENKDLFALFCNKAYELASRQKSGYETAVKAMSLLAKHLPDAVADAQNKLALIRTKQLAATSGTQQKAIATELVELNRASGGRLLREGKIAQAMAAYRRALALARRYVPQAESRVQDEYKAATLMQNTLRRVELLESKVLKNSNDVDAAEELAFLYLVELDRPAKAGQLADRVSDKSLKAAIAGAQAAPADCDESTSLAMGTWFHDAAGKTTGSSRTTALWKAQVYFQRFLSIHQQKDIHRATVELKLASIEKALAGAALPTTLPTPTAPTTPSQPKRSVRYAKKLHVLQVPISVDVKKLPDSLSSVRVTKEALHGMHESRLYPYGSGATLAIGYLKIETDGEYGFSVYGHYTGEAVFIVDTLRIQQGGAGQSGGTITLKRGRVPIMIVGRPGNKKVDLYWKKPNEAKATTIPASLWFHDVDLEKEIKKRKKKKKG